MRTRLLLICVLEYSSAVPSSNQRGSGAGDWFSRKCTNSWVTTRGSSPPA